MFYLLILLTSHHWQHSVSNQLQLCLMYLIMAEYFIVA